MRWLSVVLLLVPVLYLPTCAATTSVVVWQLRTPVDGKPSTEFPVLSISGKPGRREVRIVSIKTMDPTATYALPPAEREALIKAAKQLVQPDSGEPRHLMEVEVEAGEAEGGTQRIHLNIVRQMAMGGYRIESWYDTDGTRVTPRYERAYIPVWTYVGAAAASIPLSMVIAAVATWLLRPSGPPPAPVIIRLVFLVGGYMAIVIPSVVGAAATTAWLALFLWLLLLIAAGLVLWKSRWKAPLKGGVVLLLAIAASAVPFLMGGEAGELAGCIAAIFGTLLACAVALAWALERSFSAAWRRSWELSSARTSAPQ